MYSIRDRNVQCLIIKLFLICRFFKIVYDQKAATIKKNCKVTSARRDMHFFFAVVEFMFKCETYNDGNVPATKLSCTTFFSLLNLYGSCVDSISYPTNAETGVRSCEIVGLYFQSP
jgi:hypothetical protein